MKRVLYGAHWASPFPGRLFFQQRLAASGSSRFGKFHTSAPRDIVRPYLLADIGEGIREVQIIQWFVKPGARVEQFQRLCEVQSDKAVVEITSRFDGLVKKLHYDADDMATVGKPLVDIDIQSELSAQDEALTTPPEEKSEQTVPRGPDAPTEDAVAEGQPAQPDERDARDLERRIASIPSRSRDENTDRYRTLATPAVRRLMREMDVNIADVQGSGREGRVLKEDVLKYQESQSQSASLSASPTSPVSSVVFEDKTVSLSPVQFQMFKSMSKSLQIPHFLYTDSLDFSHLNKLRKSLTDQTSTKRISALAFIVKAVSLSLAQFPILNARLDVEKNKPQLQYRGTHNISIAVDTPSGLLVPVIKSVQSLSISEIAEEISRLGAAGRDGKLTNADLSGGTFTVSNVGSIGGGVVSPVIVEGQSAIIGVGQMKSVPAFDEHGNVIRREECVLSWSADHRIVDGATVARAAHVVKQYLENPAQMVINLR